MSGIDRGVCVHKHVCTHTYIYKPVSMNMSFSVTLKCCDCPVPMKGFVPVSPQVLRMGLSSLPYVGISSADGGPHSD